MGLELSASERSLHVAADGRLRSIDVQTLPYPGIATDYKPLVITMLSVGDDVGIVTENLYPGRFRYVEELLRLGADIRTNGHHAVVRGVPRLSGAPVRLIWAWRGDGRGRPGRPRGETVITGVGHIDRGDHDLVGRLARVGADPGVSTAPSSQDSSPRRSAARLAPPGLWLTLHRTIHARRGGLKPYLATGPLDLVTHGMGPGDPAACQPQEPYYDDDRTSPGGSRPSRPGGRRAPPNAAARAALTTRATYRRRG